MSTSKEYMDRAKGQLVSVAIFGAIATGVYFAPDLWKPGPGSAMKYEQELTLEMHKTVPLDDILNDSGVAKYRNDYADAVKKLNVLKETPVYEREKQIYEQKMHEYRKSKKSAKNLTFLFGIFAVAELLMGLYSVSRSEDLREEEEKAKIKA